MRGSSPDFGSAKSHHDGLWSLSQAATPSASCFEASDAFWILSRRFLRSCGAEESFAIAGLASSVWINFTASSLRPCAT